MLQIPLVLAQSSPSLPNWLSYVGPFVGGIGLALTYERWIVENRVQAQQAMLEVKLTEERRARESWEKQATDACRDAQNAYETLEYLLGQIDEKDLSSGDVIKLGRVLGKLKKWADVEQRLNNYKIAAKELKQSSTLLVERAVKRAIKDYKGEIPELQRGFPWEQRQKIKKFHVDVAGYVNWVYDCLYVSGHPRNNPLSRFVQSPTFSLIGPYSTAIIYIKDQGDWSRLTLEQSRSLRSMFEELLKLLPPEFEE